MHDQDTRAISDDTIREAALVVADGNLSPSALATLLTRSARLGVDVWFEPTSVQKSVRVVDAGAVGSLMYASPNGDELEAMSEAIRRKNGTTSTAPHERFKLSEQSRILPSERMHQLKNDLITVLVEMANGDTAKEKHVIVTLGKHGVLVGSINVTPSTVHQRAEASTFPMEVWGAHQIHGRDHYVAMVHLPGVEIHVKNCTGAGTLSCCVVVCVGCVCVARLMWIVGWTLLAQATAWWAVRCTASRTSTTSSRAATSAWSLHARVSCRTALLTQS